MMVLSSDAVVDADYGDDGVPDANGDNDDDSDHGIAFDVHADDAY